MIFRYERQLADVLGSGGAHTPNLSGLGVYDKCAHENVSIEKIARLPTHTPGLVSRRPIGYTVVFNC
jgi:hypothetical protein